jgi:hypothetical protein
MIGMKNMYYTEFRSNVEERPSEFPSSPHSQAHSKSTQAGQRIIQKKENKKMKRVVVCWDGSDGAKRALKAAQKMVDENIGELVLLHVSEVFEPRGPDGRPLKPVSEGPHPHPTLPQFIFFIKIYLVTLQNVIFNLNIEILHK